MLQQLIVSFLSRALVFGLRSVCIFTSVNNLHQGWSHYNRNKGVYYIKIVKMIV